MSSLTPAAEALLHEAAGWRLLALLFSYPDDDWRADLSALLPSLADDGLRAIGEAAVEYSTAGMHSALFGPAGSVPVREAAHRGGVQLGYLMAEVAAYYDAFAFAPRTPEAGDHLSVQLDFLAFLRLKQAHAICAGSGDQEQVAAEAAATFLKEHIAVQAEPVLRALENFGPDFLIEAGRRIVDRAGPAPRSDFPLSPGLDDDEMACGPSAGPDDLIQLHP
jgi:nitrate reductase assembly molybdenum cofactor insertion protein NarJ